MKGATIGQAGWESCSVYVSTKTNARENGDKKTAYRPLPGPWQGGPRPCRLLLYLSDNHWTSLATTHSKRLGKYGDFSTGRTGLGSG